MAVARVMVERQWQPEETALRQSVLVVGSGLAGLSAARALRPRPGRPRGADGERPALTLHHRRGRGRRRLPGHAPPRAGGGRSGLPRRGPDQGRGWRGRLPRDAWPRPGGPEAESGGHSGGHADPGPARRRLPGKLSQELSLRAAGARALPLRPRPGPGRGLGPGARAGAGGLHPVRRLSRAGQPPLQPHLLRALGARRPAPQGAEPRGQSLRLLPRPAHLRTLRAALPPGARGGRQLRAGRGGAAAVRASRGDP